MHPTASRLADADMPDHQPGREDGDAKHDGRFRQLGRLHAKSRDSPKRADCAEHEFGGEHEGEIEHASLEGFLQPCLPDGHRKDIAPSD